MSFVDTNSDPFFAPFNFVMDYDGLLPSSRGSNTPSTKRPQPWQELNYQPLSMAQAESMASSWSMQAAFTPESTPSNHSMNTPATNFHNQNMSGPDPLLFPEASQDAMDFVSFWHNQNKNMFPLGTANQPANPSAVSNMDFSAPPNIPPLSAGNRPAPEPPSSNKQQQSTNLTHHDSPPHTTQNTCPHSPQNCLSSALEILQTLHIPPPSCLSSISPTNPPSPARTPRKTDFVLATNRTAIQLISKISSCPCTSSRQIQLLLIIISDKLIAWYRALLHSFPSQPQDALALEPNTPPDPSSTAYEPSERVLYQRFAVGSCSFDAGLERRIFGQVILSEVQRLESVILDFDTRLREEGYCGLESGPDGQGRRKGSMIEGAGLAGGVCGRLSAVLLGKVEELRGEIGGDT